MQFAHIHDTCELLSKLFSMTLSYIASVAGVSVKANKAEFVPWRH